VLGFLLMVVVVGSGVPPAPKAPARLAETLYEREGGSRIARSSDWR
jgi:hypothetical protein